MNSNHYLSMQFYSKISLSLLFTFSSIFLVLGQKEITEKSMVTGKKITITTNDKNTKKVNHNLERKKRSKTQYKVLYVRADEAQEVKANKKNRKYNENEVIEDEKKKKSLNYYYMSGNPCVEQVTHKYGFEYELVPKTVKMNVFRRFFHNLGVNTIIFFKRGPFWKSSMKKKIRDCMGDVYTT